MNFQHERIAELCAELRLGGIAADYATAAQKAAQTEVSYPDFLERLLRSELDMRRGSGTC
jgi:hypothetical protein